MPRGGLPQEEQREGADRIQPNTVTANHPKNAAFAATRVAPSVLWFRRVVTAAARYTPTGNNPHTWKRGVIARYAEAGPTVYEALLSYRSFFAEEDLYEVKKAGEPDDPLKSA